MKVYQTAEIRNIALVGGAKSGKTTLSECMIYEGGLINRRGTVDDKNTVSDYREIEHERENSVSSTVMYAEFEGKKINIIDTPVSTTLWERLFHRSKLLTLPLWLSMLKMVWRSEPRSVGDILRETIPR